MAAQEGGGLGNKVFFPGWERCDHVCKPRAGRQQQRRNWPFMETSRGRKCVLGWGLGRAALTVSRFIFGRAP